MLISKKNYIQSVSLTFNVDAEKLHKIKVKSGAIDKATSVEDSLSYDMTQLQMDVYSHVHDFMISKFKIFIFTFQYYLHS